MLHSGRVRRMVAVSVAALLGASACASGRSAGSSASAPLIVCGTQLHAGSNAPVLIRVMGELPPVELNQQIQTIYIRVSDSCAHGARVEVRPHDASRLAKTAVADDGLPVVEVLHLIRHRAFTVTATSSGDNAVRRFVFRGVAS